jgi:hypothetical protein
MYFVDYDFYAAEYRRSSNLPAIPESEWGYFESKAQSRINRRNAEFAADDSTDAMKLCICAAAEIIFAQDQAESPEAVKSFNNDGYSVSYADQKKTQAEVSRAIGDAAREYLKYTDQYNKFYHIGILD